MSRCIQQHINVCVCVCVSVGRWGWQYTCLYLLFVSSDFRMRCEGERLSPQLIRFMEQMKDKVASGQEGDVLLDHTVCAVGLCNVCDTHCCLTITISFIPLGIYCQVQEMKEWMQYIGQLTHICLWSMLQCLNNNHLGQGFHESTYWWANTHTHTKNVQLCSVLFEHMRRRLLA